MRGRRRGRRKGKKRRRGRKGRRTGRRRRMGRRIKMPMALGHPNHPNWGQERVYLQKWQTRLSLSVNHFKRNNQGFSAIGHRDQSTTFS